MRMLQRGEDLTLGGEPRRRARIEQAAAGDLEGDLAAEEAVGPLGAVDLAHAALADLLDQPVDADERAVRRRLGPIGCGWPEESTGAIVRRPAAIAPPPRPPRRRRPSRAISASRAAGSPSISTAAPNTASTRDQNSESANGTSWAVNRTGAAAPTRRAPDTARRARRSSAA